MGGDRSGPNDDLNDDGLLDDVIRLGKAADDGDAAEVARIAAKHRNDDGTYPA